MSLFKGFKGTTILLRALGLAVLLCATNQATASGPAFLVSVSNSTSHLSEMIEVTATPFGTNAVLTTNAGFISTNAAPWSAMSFSPAGTLYGITLGSELGAIDPASAAFSVFTDLHTIASTSGVENLIAGTGLAFSTNGTGYVADGVNLYTANPASGLCSNIGSFSQAGSIGTPFVFALAEAPNGTMFGLFLGLYTLNLSNAQVTQIGAAFPFGGGNNTIYALSAAFGSDSNLYMVGWNNVATNHPKLYQVNTNIGTVTALGNLPFGANGLVALNSANDGAPAIVIPPASQTVLAGANVTFSVTGAGSPTPEAQWYFGNAEDPGATNFTLTITNASPSNAGNYSVVLSNAIGTATSVVVMLTVKSPILGSTGTTGSLTNSILGLTTNPPTETVLLGSNVFFSCLCFAPQGELFGMTVDALYAINTQTWAASLIGDFRTNGAIAQNPIGMAFSPSGVLYASYGGSFYTMATNTAQASLVGAFSNGVAIGGLAFAPNGTLYGGETNLYTINPTNGAAAKVGALNGASASILADMKYGTDGFLYFCDGGSDGNLYRLNPSNAQVSVAANYPVTLSGLAFVPIPTVIVAEPTNQIVVTGKAATFSVTATGTTPLAYQWFFGKAAIPSGTNSVLTIPTASAKNNGTYFVEVSNSLGAVTSSIVTLTTYTPAMITKPPEPMVIRPGQTINLSVGATGSPLDYQWQLDGTNLAGKTASGLTIAKAGTNDAGTYTIVVSNPFLAQTASASASVAVIPLTPSISSPVNKSVTGAENLTVTGHEPANGGAASIAYQLNGGAAQMAEIASNGLTWSAAVSLVPGTNVFLVWATNSSGASGTVEAQYVLNPFIPVAGAYHGLFSEAGSPAFTNSGYFTLTLENDRVFTGDILLDGAQTPFTGQFDTNGAAAFAASNAPSRSYDVELQLDLSGLNPLTGSISNTARTWTASLSAVRSAFGGTLPATNFEGKYLLTILNGATNPLLAPVGYSYGMASISVAGAVTFTGAMADGTIVTSTGVGISRSGEWPLYVSLFSGKGSVLAWVQFPALSAPSQMTSSQALWFETGGTSSHFYTNGFSLLTNQLSLLLNRYTAPARGVAVLPRGNYTVQIFGGNLNGSLSNNITISTNNVVLTQGANTNQLSIAINAASGTFSGSFVGPGTSRPTAFNGVLLPDNNAGYGYFLGTNQTGGILIQP